MTRKWIAKIEATLEIEGEADSLSDFQFLVRSKLGGLFFEDEDYFTNAGLTILKMESIGELPKPKTS